MNTFKIILFVLLASALPSHADTVTPEPGTRATAKIEKITAEITKRFTKADADQSGTLTLSEAQNGMPRVAKNFSAIDSAGTGAVTLDQIKAYMVDHIETKRASR